MTDTHGKTYVVVEAADLEELVHEVNRLMTRDWQPTGGITYSRVEFTDRKSNHSVDHCYWQAMKRHVPEKSTDPEDDT